MSSGYGEKLPEKIDNKGYQKVEKNDILPMVIAISVVSIVIVPLIVCFIFWYRKIKQRNQIRNLAIVRSESMIPYDTCSKFRDEEKVIFQSKRLRGLANDFENSLKIK